MDTRTGDIYPSFESAREAGVPEKSLAEVVGMDGDVPIIRFRSGPFKKRLYKRLENGNLARVDKDTGRGVWKYDGKGVLVRVRV